MNQSLDYDRLHIRTHNALVQVEKMELSSCPSPRVRGTPDLKTGLLQAYLRMFGALMISEVGR